MSLTEEEIKNFFKDLELDNKSTLEETKNNTRAWH